MSIALLLCLVVGVTDGDTLSARCGGPDKFEQITVQLNAIDAPELQQAYGRSAKDHPVWVLHGASAPDPARRAWDETGAELIAVPEADGRLDLAAALRSLAGRGLTRILNEGGSTLAAALIRAGLVDDLALFSGGVLIGAEGHPALGDLRLAALADAPRPILRETERLGADLYSLWSFARPGSGISS